MTTEPGHVEKTLTRAEVRESRDRALLVLYNGVYDVTAFGRTHPGGEAVISEFVGRDATSAFESVGHSTRARAMLERLRIGTLAPADTVPTRSLPR